MSKPILTKIEERAFVDFLERYDKREDGRPKAGFHHAAAEYMRATFNRKFSAVRLYNWWYHRYTRAIESGGARPEDPTRPGGMMSSSAVTGNGRLSVRLDKIETLLSTIAAAQERTAVAMEQLVERGKK
jgi:hypothetical protein